MSLKFPFACFLGFSLIGLPAALARSPISTNHPLLSRGARDHHTRQIVIQSSPRPNRGSGRGQSSNAYRPARGETDIYGTIYGKGQFIIKLYTREAPRATSHIATLVRSGFYDGQRFFRVITRPRPYLVQIGDPASRTEPMDSPRLGQGGSGVSVKFEASGLSHEDGSVALATADGNRDSGDSQFYITLGNFSRLLDGTDTVFGRVVQGLDIIHRIELGDILLNLRVVEGN